MQLLPSELLDCVSAGSEDTRSLPSTVIVVAHPDDETIGLGGRLSRYREATFIYITDGAPRNMQDARAVGCTTREEYAKKRREELNQVFLLSGIDPVRALSFDFVDQETPFHLTALSRTLADMFRNLLADVVITHPYEGGHPDHDAAAFGVHTAVRLLKRVGGSVPIIVEMTSYHNRQGFMATSEFLPNSTSEDATRVLTDRERAFKQKLFETYQTQAHVLRHFPFAVERFRLAPLYNFLQAPHEGELYYEKHDWGMSSNRWKELVRESYDELQLHGQGSEFSPMISTYIR